MANVSGLRPTQNDQPMVRQKKGRLVVSRNTSNRTSLRPTAAPVDSYVRPGATPDVSSNAERLANALGQLNPVIGQLSEQYRRKQEEKQLQNIPYYVEQLMRDKEMGAVSAAQVKEVFPELVPTVASRIAQAMGERKAKDWIQGRIQNILENDEIRLNTQLRNQELEAIRQEAREFTEGNEFFGAGFISQMNTSLREFETAWMRETAAYQEKVQAESFANHVTETLMSGGDLLELDATWKETSSLNNIERNSIVVNTVVSQALATGNEKILDKVPDRFLNAESKAQLAQTRDQIQQARYTQRYRAMQMEQWDRANQIREGKIGILQRLSSGEELNPAEFAHTPELFEYTLRLQSQPTISSTMSVRNAETIKANILRAATTGSFFDSFGDDPAFVRMFENEEAISEDGMRDYILQRSDLNPSEQQALIEQVPTLMEGVNFVRNPDFEAHFDNTIGNDLKSYGQSIEGQILQQMGVNVQGIVQTAYKEHLRQEVIAYIEEHDEVPKGMAKLEIMQRADAVARERLRYYQQNYKDVLRESTMDMVEKSGSQRRGQMSRSKANTDNGKGNSPSVTKRWNPETGKLEIVDE